MTFTQPNYRYLRRHRGGRWNVAAGRKLGDFKPWRNRVTFDVSAAQRIVRLESKDAIRKSPKFRVDVGRNVPRSRHHGVFPFDSWEDRLHVLWRVRKFLPIRRNGLDLFWTDFGFACQVFRGWNSRYLNFLFLNREKFLMTKNIFVIYFRITETSIMFCWSSRILFILSSFCIISFEKNFEFFLIITL